MPGRMRPTTLFVRKSHCKRTVPPEPMRRRMAKRIKKVGVAESVAQQLSMLVRCLGRHANYLRAHLLPGIPCEFVARDQLRCRS